MQFTVKWTGEPSAESKCPYIRGVIALGAGFGMDEGEGQQLRARSESGENTLSFNHPDTPECLDHALDRVRRMQDDLRRMYGVESAYEVNGKPFPAYIVEVFGELCSMRTVVQQVVSDLRATRGVPLLRDKRIAAARIKLEGAIK